MPSSPAKWQVYQVHAVFSADARAAPWSGFGLGTAGPFRFPGKAWLDIATFLE
jgi:hypothetical protein